MSYIVSIYHVVLSTYKRQNVIRQNQKKDIYYYIWGIIKKHQCKLIRMNGMPNHIHILLELHPSVALADLIREIKRSSSIWIKENNYCQGFNGWGKEYAAFSCSSENSDIIKNYIINQEKHHKVLTFEEEIRKLFEENGLACFPSRECV